MNCPECQTVTNVSDHENKYFLGKNVDGLPWFKCSACGAIFLLQDGLPKVGKRGEHGKRFVPVTTGLFFMALSGCVFLIWGSNPLTMIIGGLLALYGGNALRVGIWGSQQLLDEMTLDTELSTKATEEYQKINKL